jgi:hypothetical protein
MSLGIELLLEALKWPSMEVFWSYGACTAKGRLYEN